jgi:hypothetical protein
VGGGVFGGGTFIHPAFADVSSYQASINRYAGHSNSYVPLGQRTGCPVGPHFATGLYCPVEEQKVNEDVDAAYFMFKFGGDDTKIGNVSVKGNIGVRWVRLTSPRSAACSTDLDHPNPPQAGQPHSSRQASLLRRTSRS